MKDLVFWLFLCLILNVLARIHGLTNVFYRFDSDEAYQSSDGTIARTVGGNRLYLGNSVNEFREPDVEGLRIKRAVSLLEKSGGLFLKRTADRNFRRRLSVLFAEVFKHDPTHFLPGLRSIYEGLQTEAGRRLLTGFDFNIHSRASTAVTNSFNIDITTGRLQLFDFSPAALLACVPPARSLEVRFFLSQVNFLYGEFFTIFTDARCFTAADTTQDLELCIGDRPLCEGVYMAYLWIGFEREDIVAVPERFKYVDDVFRLVACEPAPLT